MNVVQSEVDGIQGLFTKVLEIGKSLRPEAFLWYRGHTCAKFDLLPKIMRDGRSAVEVLERERRLLTRFRQRSMAYWPAGYPQDEWEHLFAMQHYGMPTRLLDWSENLFVAAYFALGEAIGCKRHDGDCIPTVWCIDPVDWNRKMPMLSEYGTHVHVLTTADDELEAYSTTSSKRRLKSPVALFGAHNSARIVAQRGTFMIWGNETRPLQEVACAQGAQLWCIKLKGKRATMAEDLRLLGFSETMVFPELPSLGNELSRCEGWRNDD